MWQVKDSNLRSLRDGFTVRSHWPLGQPAVDRPSRGDLGKITAWRGVLRNRIGRAADHEGAVGRGRGGARGARRGGWSGRVTGGLVSGPLARSWARLFQAAMGGEVTVAASHRMNRCYLRAPTDPRKAMPPCLHTDLDDLDVARTPTPTPTRIRIRTCARSGAASTPSARMLAESCPNARARAGGRWGCSPRPRRRRWWGR